MEHQGKHYGDIEHHKCLPVQHLNVERMVEQMEPAATEHTEEETIDALTGLEG